MNNSFESQIKKYLKEKYGDISDEVFELSYILKYIAYKTKSANRGAKSRGSFANLYAIYVIVEDYLTKKFDITGNYGDYEGAQYNNLLLRQRQLPFGAKLQNHALNSRMNEEFYKLFPTKKEVPPITRNLETKRYWFNENYLKIKIGGEEYNIAEDIIAIINQYIAVKQDSFVRFIQQCEQLKSIEDSETAEVSDFIMSLLQPNVDARLFEIVSFAILKYKYRGQTIYWGYSPDDLVEESLHLYKTGRTNANDGGIDFVMKPLGKFFQVTETLDFKKYFLDIEKIERYPISFVIKSEESESDLRKKLKEDAIKTYVVKSVVENYLSCIDEIITIPDLKSFLADLDDEGSVSEVLHEIILQSKVEFNYEDEDDVDETDGSDSLLVGDNSPTLFDSI